MEETMKALACSRELRSEGVRRAGGMPSTGSVAPERPPGRIPRRGCIFPGRLLAQPFRDGVPWCRSRAEMPFPSYAPTVPEFIRTRREAFGPRPLILLGDHRISYAEADELSARLARGLLARGIAKGARVGL